MIELLQNLVKIESISPKDMGCFDIIENELRDLNFNCERINYLKDRYSIKLNNDDILKDYFVEIFSWSVIPKHILLKIGNYLRENHLNGIKLNGISPWHRRTYGICRDYC